MSVGYVPEVNHTYCVGSREISEASDLLAIAANCCNYSVRLNTKSLGSTSCSLSLSVLALFLFNGDIIMNHGHDENLLSKNIFNCLQLLALASFDPPVEDKELMFIKKCRLINVRLSLDGIVTSGRLWKLHKKIEIGEFTFEPSFNKSSRKGLNGYQRSRLRQLSLELQLQGHETLANDLDDFLDEDIRVETSRLRRSDTRISWPSKSSKPSEPARLFTWVIWMAQIHIVHIAEFFVTDPTRETPSHVFTAWSRLGSGGKGLDDIYPERLLDKIVS